MSGWILAKPNVLNTDHIERIWVRERETDTIPSKWQLVTKMAPSGDVVILGQFESERLAQNELKAVFDLLAPEAQKYTDIGVRSWA